MINTKPISNFEYKNLAQHQSVGHSSILSSEIFALLPFYTSKNTNEEYYLKDYNYSGGIK